jgi:hypothetical protein
MRKIIFIISTVLVLPITTIAQQEIRNRDGSYFKQCKHFEISKPLRELAKEHPAELNKDGKRKEARDAERKFSHKRLSAAPSTEDPIVQREQGAQAVSSPIENFNGQVSTDGYYPFDPTGAVGPNHFVQSVNSNYQVFDKTGTAVTAPVDLATLITGSSDQGDPIVMYDKFADRWIITEFETDNPPNGTINELLFAVSTSPDPTGTYYLYTFEPDAADFADYPKYSIWPDGYYETCNCDNQKVTVYDRAKMLNGDQTAGFIVIPSIANPNPGGFWCPQTLFADGQLPPYGSPQYMFYFTDDNWGGSFQDKIMIYKITTNWSGHTGSLTLDNTLTPQPFNSYFTGGTLQDISQPGTTNTLDALDGFFAYRIPFMRWEGYNSAVMCNTVNTGSGSTLVAGIRWYELHQDTTTKAWSIFQQGTYSPSDGVSRWNPSIAMDMNGSIGLAYSVSAPTTVYPGIRYTGRRKCDADGIMSVTEGTAISGLTVYTGNDNRWGDYSHTTIDPADGGLTFWHTNQYMGSNHTLKTRIFSFQIPSCTATGISTLNENKNGINLTAYQSESLLNIKATNISQNDNIDVSLFTIEGKFITNKMIAPLAGTLETTINTAGLAKGIYYVRISNHYFQRVTKVPVQ